MIGPAGRIGIIAGAGSLPAEVARSVVARGGSVHVVMADGADPALAAFPHTIVNWAQLGRATAALKHAGVHDIIVLGAGTRPTFRNARPDLAFFRVLPSVLRLLRAGGDDAVLRGLLGVFEGQGFAVIGVGDVARELLVAEGSLTKCSPSPEEAGSIERGFALIAALGRYDIGQGVVLTGNRIEAIEGAEGTDRMLKRVAENRRRAGNGERGGVLVKRPKPGQDLRVDLPAIGPDTSRNAAAAGLSGIAVMAGNVLAAERPEMLRIADACGLFIAGVQVRSASARSFASVPDIAKPVSLGSLRIRDQANAEIARACGILSELAAFATGSALVSCKGRVLAIGADEPPGEVIERSGAFRKPNAHRTGLAAVGPRHAIDAAVLHAADQSRLAGVVQVRRGPDRDIAPDLIRLADKLGLFIAAAEIATEGGAP
jgi:DUF1009 family protein